MSTIYTSSTDFADQELAVLVGTFGEGIPEGFDLQELFDRLRDAGMIEWHDAYDKEANVYRLDHQGFRWVVDEGDLDEGERGVIDEERFWDIVTRQIEESR